MVFRFKKFHEGKYYYYDTCKGRFVKEADVVENEWLEYMEVTEDELFLIERIDHEHYCGIVCRFSICNDGLDLQWEVVVELTPDAITYSNKMKEEYLDRFVKVMGRDRRFEGVLKHLKTDTK